MSSYMKITQGEEESVTQYLEQKHHNMKLSNMNGGGLNHLPVVQERINHTSKLSNMNGGGLNHLPVVQGIKDSYIR